MSHRAQSPLYKRRVRPSYVQSKCQRLQPHSETIKANCLRGTVLKRGFAQSDYMSAMSRSIKEGQVNCDFGLRALPLFKKGSCYSTDPMQFKMVPNKDRKVTPCEQQLRIKAQKKFPKHRTVDNTSANETISHSTIFKANPFPYTVASKTSLNKEHGRSHATQPWKKEANSPAVQRGRFSSTGQTAGRAWNWRGSGFTASQTSVFGGAEKGKRLESEIVYLQSLLKIDNLGPLAKAVVNPLANMIRKAAIKELDGIAQATVSIDSMGTPYEDTVRTEEKANECETNAASKESRAAIINYMTILSSNKYKVIPPQP